MVHGGRAEFLLRFGWGEEGSEARVLTLSSTPCYLCRAEAEFNGLAPIPPTPTFYTSVVT